MGQVRLSLGCSRFGSLVRGVDGPSATRLIHAALDMGVRDFDTANIYGQGDSERFLGAALHGVSGVCITTKAGQVFPPLKRVMIPFKKLLKPLVNRPGMAEKVSAERAAELPRDWSSRHLRISLEKSLRRLKRDAVDIFLLHSPDTETILRGEAMHVLALLQEEGKARMVGISVDDGSGLVAALDDPRVQAIQFPLSPNMPANTALLATARSRGVTLISREILASSRDPIAIDAALDFAARQAVDVALLGTGNVEHLDHARRMLKKC
jgi:aryl-alcohol dehydrogenase-like predicted oxidoreductase